MDSHSKLWSLRQKIQPQLAHLSLELSEYCFANLLLFEKNHDYKIITGKTGTFLEGSAQDHHRYIMPLEDLDLNAAYLAELKELSSHYDYIFPIPERWLPHFSQMNWEHTYSDNESDYIYSYEKMSTFAGKKYHKKRNLVHQHTKLYEVDHRALTAEDIPQCIEIVNQWSLRYQELTGKGDHDLDSCVLALQNMEKLNLNGCITLADNKISGFALGEFIGTSSLYAIHFAKAAIEYKGIYQYLFQTFSANYVDSTRCEFINLEQDLGLDGLRQTKHSYYPIKMGCKYRMSKKK